MARRSKAEKLALIALGQNGLRSVKTRAMQTSVNNAVDIAIGSATAGGKNFYQDTEPLASESNAGNLWFDTSDNNKIYKYTGDAWTLAIMDENVVTITGGKLAANSVVANHIVTGTIDASKLHVDALSTSKFYCSDSNSELLHSGITIRNLTETVSSLIAVGGFSTKLSGTGVHGSVEDGGTGSRGIVGVANEGSGVVGVGGITSNCFGVQGNGNVGVKGYGDDVGVWGHGINGYGVYGEASEESAIFGNNTSIGYAGYFINSGASQDWVLYVEQTGTTTNYISYVKGSMQVNSVCAVGTLYSFNDATADYFNAGDGDGGGAGDAYGLTTGAYKAYIGGGVEPFTGAHICLMSEVDKPVIGDIATVYDAYGHSISQSYFYVRPSIIANDKKIVGVYTGVTQPIMDMVLSTGDFSEPPVRDENNPPIGDEVRILKEEYADYINNLISEGYYTASVNSVGEGMMNVCDENGDIESGDYICSSNVFGKGMRQESECMMNYTVAKALETVAWSDESQNVKLICVTYHCG